jgi:hypothetical protein
LRQAKICYCSYCGVNEKDYEYNAYCKIKYHYVKANNNHFACTPTQVIDDQSCLPRKTSLTKPGYDLPSGGDKIQILLKPSPKGMISFYKRGWGNNIFSVQAVYQDGLKKGTYEVL